MSFYVSKLIWAILQPTTLSMIVLGAGLLLGGGRSLARFGRRLAIAALLALAVMGFTPFPYLLTIPLEQRFPRPDVDAIAAPTTLIVLGGSVDNITSLARNSVALNEAAERLTEAAVLARRFPEAKLILSGGKANLLFDALSEAEVMRNFLLSLGIERERMILEDLSRTTGENTDLTAALIAADPALASSKPWLLTSAFHMPRAIGTFRKAGLDVVAYPTDFRTRGWDDAGRTPDSPSDGWRRSDLIVREWVGLLGYWLTGRTAELWPGPQSD